VADAPPPAAFAVDPDGRLLSWSREAEELLGWRPDEVLGRSCFDVLRGKDPFGNRYCGERCPIRTAAVLGRASEPFLVTVEGSFQCRPVRVSAGARPEPGPGFASVVHVLEPEDADRFQRLQSACRTALRGGPRLALVEDDNPLTAREREVVRLLAAGLTTVEIGGKLCIARATVRNHVQSVLRKLEVHGQVEAVAVALRRGFIRES
jgi:DNA-binding CsgD family transcriptional regulator